MMRNVRVLFEDRDIIVVVKPAGIPSQSDKKYSTDMVGLLKGELLLREKRAGKREAKEPYIAVVHRLDRNVSGVMVYGKNRKAAAELSRAIREHRFQKTYILIADQKKDLPLSKNDGFVNLKSFLSYDKINNLTLLTQEGEGDEAILEYQVLDTSSERALIQVRLITGRKHQIRLQMTEISEGICGDKKYNSLAKTEEKRVHGPALECVSLGFCHPITKEKLEFHMESRLLSSWNAMK